MKPFIVHNTPTLRQTSTKVIVCVAALKSFRICLLDITQAYLQSKDQISKQVYIHPNQKDQKYFGYNEDALLLLENVTRRQDHPQTFATRLSKQVKLVPMGATFKKFQSARACLSWMCLTRPDISCSVNRACQVMEDGFESWHIKELNKSISHFTNTKSVILQYPELDVGSIHLRAYSDASFATNDDIFSQVGHIILLADQFNRCHVLWFSSKKSREVVRSIRAGEIFAFSNAFGSAIMIRHDMKYCSDRRSH